MCFPCCGVGALWRMCGLHVGVFEIEAWFSSVHKKMAYSRVTSLRTIACSYHVIEISSPTRQRRPSRVNYCNMFKAAWCALIVSVSSGGTSRS